MSAIALVGLPLSTANAQAEDPILTLPDGQVILSISATERQDVEQDLLIATLSYTVTEANPRLLQDEINTVMKKAVDAAKKVASVKVNTGGYQVYETTDPRTKERKWQGSQSLTLKSKAAQDVLDLAGALQDLGLTMNGLSYTIDPDTAVAVQDSLMEAALAQLQTRATRAAKALGKSKAELRDVQVQGQDFYIPQTYDGGAVLMQAKARSIAAPVAEAGEQTLTLTVSARALLKP
jgi:predicted secreted protein